MGLRSSPSRPTVSPQPPPPDRRRPSPKFGDSSPCAAVLQSPGVRVHLELDPEKWIHELGGNRRNLECAAATRRPVCPEAGSGRPLNELCHKPHSALCGLLSGQ